MQMRTPHMLRLLLVAALLSCGATAHAQYGDNDVDFYEPDTYGDTDYGYDEAYTDTGEYEDEELSDLEYEPGEGLHEEEWYDPSDWFDTDTGVSYESDAWDSNAYGYDGYGYGDDDYGYDGYDYGYDNYYTNDWYDDGGIFNDWY